MLEGLRELLTVASSAALPAIHTRHRVIGTDACHFMAPATRSEGGEEAGKLFLTAQRVIFAAGHVTAAPWHRVRAVVRDGRALALTVAGAGDWVFRCNTYGDAMVACHLADRLRQSVGGRP